MQVFSLVQSYNNGQDIENEVFSSLEAAHQYIKDWAYDAEYDIDWHGNHNAHVWEMETEFTITTSEV